MVFPGGRNQVGRGGPPSEESGPGDSPPGDCRNELLPARGAGVAERGIKTDSEHRQQDMDDQSCEDSTRDCAGIMQTAEGIGVHWRLSGGSCQVARTLADYGVTRE
jgi:hypothetical protein